MGHAIRGRNLRGELVESPEVSASDAKNVGRILDYVATTGGVTITRRRTPLAVVIPIDTYTRLLAAEENALDTLTSEFDALLARMQQPGMAEAMERAFAMSPAQLGAAAVAQARSPLGAAAVAQARSQLGAAAEARSQRPSRARKRGKRKLPRAK